MIRHQALGPWGARNLHPTRPNGDPMEVGHYLDLHHIWGSDSPTCGDSDLVDDTPNQEQPSTRRLLFLTYRAVMGPMGTCS